MTLLATPMAATPNPLGMAACHPQGGFGWLASHPNPHWIGWPVASPAIWEDFFFSFLFFFFFYFFLFFIVLVLKYLIF
jgi:hypothetical protein